MTGRDGEEEEKVCDNDYSELNTKKVLIYR